MRGNDPIGSALRKLLVERSCFIVNSTVVYRRDALLKIGGFVEAEGLGQDYPTWIRLSLEGKFAAVPAFLGYYRKHPHSLTHMNDPDLWFDNNTDFLLGFVSHYSQTLSGLGICYDVERLKKNWEDIKKYIPYNRAMYMLMNGCFDEAKAEFKVFLDKVPSAKHRIMNLMFTLTALTKFDLLSPLANVKMKLKRSLRPDPGRH